MEPARHPDGEFRALRRRAAPAETASRFDGQLTFPRTLATHAESDQVLSAGGDFEVRPQVTGDLAAIGTADVVFLGVKAHSLTALAPQLQPLVGPRYRGRQYAGRHPVVGLPVPRRRAGRTTLERVDPGGVIATAIEPPHSASGAAG